MKPKPEPTRTKVENSGFVDPGNWQFHGRGIQISKDLSDDMDGILKLKFCIKGFVSILSASSSHQIDVKALCD